MKVRTAVVSLLLLASCRSQPPEPNTHFKGAAMDRPYHIAIGQTLSASEKKAVAALIAETFAESDRLFNLDNPDSEIARLNETRSAPLSRPLYDLLTFCGEIVAVSGGRFDPTIEPLTRLWKNAFVTADAPSSEEQQAACDAVGWHHIRLQEGLIEKDNPATRLDLSGVAKGRSVDWIAERLAERGYPNHYVEWSGEIRAGGKPADAPHWEVIVDPHLRIQGQPIAPIPLCNAALSISGDCKQKKWRLKTADGKDRYYHHIIDPLQAQPLEKTEYSIAAVTVIAPTSALADALATAAMVFPTRKEAESWAREVIELYPEVSFWILAYDIKQNSLL